MQVLSDEDIHERLGALMVRRGTKRVMSLGKRQHTVNMNGFHAIYEDL